MDAGLLSARHWFGKDMPPGGKDCQQAEKMGVKKCKELIIKNKFAEIALASKLQRQQPSPPFTVYQEHTMAMPISPVSNYNSYAPKTNSTNRQAPPATPAATSPETDPPVNQGGTLGSMINTKA